jgi:1-deoxy-D-xylulose-5-phosphate synthase
VPAHECDGERAQVRREGRSSVVLLVFGALLQEARLAAEALDATLVNMRTVKPLDCARLSELSVRHRHLVTLEENVVAGGAGAAVAEALRLAGNHAQLLQLGIPEGFVHKGARQALLEAAGLDAAAITVAVRNWLRHFEPAAAQLAGGA